MSIPRLVGTDFGGPPTAPAAPARAVAGHLGRRRCGRGRRQLRASAAASSAGTCPATAAARRATPFTIADLAAGVLALADDSGAETFHYAGDSVGGCVGLQLLLDAPHRVASATLLCTGAAIGTPDGWRERAADRPRRRHRRRARRRGASAGSPPASPSASPHVSAALLDALRDTDPRVLRPDLRGAGRLRRHRPAAPRSPPRCWPSPAADDVPTPPESLQRIASGVKDGRLVVLDGVGHLAPAEAPDAVAD